MRKTTMTMIAAAALGLSALAPASGSAAPAAAAAPVAPSEMVRTVQSWGAGPQPWDDGGWERRRQWRAWRQQQDEARIADAARREAWRIEQGREQRRAWWRAQREQQYGSGSYGPYGAGHRYRQGW